MLGCDCTKMRLAAGLRPDPLGSYSAPPDPLVVITGGGREWGNWFFDPSKDVTMATHFLMAQPAG